MAHRNLQKGVESEHLEDAVEKFLQDGGTIETLPPFAHSAPLPSEQKASGKIISRAKFMKQARAARAAAAMREKTNEKD